MEREGKQSNKKMMKKRQTEKEKGIARDTGERTRWGRRDSK